VVVQQTLNATLRSELGSAFWAAFISYTTGTLTLLLVLVVIREPWLALSTIAKSSPSSWIGGVFGTVYIVASIMLLPFRRCDRGCPIDCRSNANLSGIRSFWAIRAHAAPD
jgi:uncharacterized membrane protein YdcZ (DUF606 family)